MSGRKSKRRIAREYAEAIITALVLALVIRAYVVQAFKIPTGSMVDTLLVGDHILVNKFLFGVPLPFVSGKVAAIRQPRRGDIVVFKYPEDPSRDFIKRVIGTGGDTVEGIDKQVYVNGVAIEEPYADYRDERTIPRGGEPRDNFGPIRVPEDKYFMMGDNRDYSYDSRFWGFVDADAVRGKALIIYWSWDSARHLPRVDRLLTAVR
jgi:signal peptidase I